MYYYLVAPQAVIRAEEAAFTYHYDSPLAIGTLVRVSVGRKLVNGVVVEHINQKPSFATKVIDNVIAPSPLPKPLVKLAMWMSDYYVTHLGTVLQTILPAGLQRTRKDQKPLAHPIRRRTKIVLNEEQRNALFAITRTKTGTVLLHGVTGSGKTQVYIEAAKNQARQNRSSIILVPEIALTPQLVAEFANDFPRLIVTHSAMTEAQRHIAWSQALQADPKQPVVVIGPRSALFMPLTNVGLIVIDECHETSYKQEQSPRYSALRAASILAQQHKATLVLGSATPAATDYYIAQNTKSPIVKLTRPIARTATVQTEVVDFKRRDLFRRHRFFSDTLLAHIAQAIADNKQTLLFHNRRGTSPTTLCEHCGWLAECPSCYLPLTLHADQHLLRCHLCGHSKAVPPSCPQCKEATIAFKGIGTKLIEAEIIKLFPKARIARFDADTHPTQAVHSRYQELYDGHIDILIGTQMLAKGLDLPGMRIVGVIQADSGLVLPDYQAEERVFQLLYQVAGRVGRGNEPGQVVIQTYQPDHPVIANALARDYRSFYQAELRRRQNAHFPPFVYLLKLTCSYKTEAGAINASQKMAASLRKTRPGLEVLGPTPAFYERLGSTYRWQLIIKSKQRSTLVDVARATPQGWQADLDPVSLL